MPPAEAEGREGTAEARLSAIIEAAHQAGVLTDADRYAGAPPDAKIIAALAQLGGMGERLYWATDPSYPCPTCGHVPAAAQDATPERVAAERWAFVKAKEHIAKHLRSLARQSEPNRAAGYNGLADHYERSNVEDAFYPWSCPGADDYVAIRGHVSTAPEAGERSGLHAALDARFPRLADFRAFVYQSCQLHGAPEAGEGEPELHYEKLERRLREAPVTWIPALLVALVETAVRQDVFAPGGLEQLVERALAQGGSDG